MTNFDLLRQIQEDAVSNAVPVSTLLRRCQMFAARVGIPELGAWVRHELDGYPSDVDLPEYHVFDGVARGHFFGPFGSGIRNAVLPAGNLPEGVRDWARKAYIRQPIVALEEVAKKGEHNVTFPWPADLVAHVQGRFYEHMALGQAWLEVSCAGFIASVESVRNRILAFALEAEQYVGEEADGREAQGAAISNVFHTHVYGTVQNLAQGSTGVMQHGEIPPGDLPALVAELRALGVPDDDITDLQEALTDERPPSSDNLGPRVTAWIGRMVSKAASGAWSVATTTAATVLPKLIERYYFDPS
jgi:hypothetical protein